MSVSVDAKTLMRVIRGGQVYTRGNDIVVVKKGVGSPVTVILSPEGKNKYELKFPTYIFVSRISHFSPKEEEHRYCRNKTVLISIIRDLKRAQIWPKIINRDFLKVNDLNRKASKKDREETLQGLLSIKKPFK